MPTHKAIGASIFFVVLNALGSDALELPQYMFSGRVLERLLIVIFGGAALYWGYKLFSITTSEAGKLIAQRGEWKFQLSQVGPGVFFALFGASILVYALSAAPRFIQNAHTDNDDEGSAKVSVYGATPAVAAPSSTKLDYLITLTTLKREVVEILPPADLAKSKSIQKLFSNLEPVRRDLLDGALNAAGRYSEWSHLNDLRMTDPLSFSEKLNNDKKLKQRFEESDDLLTRVRDQ